MSIITPNSSIPSEIPQGLQNFGNSCYFNSAMQILLQIPIFGDQLITNNPTLNTFKQFYVNYHSNNNLNSSFLRDVYIASCMERKYPLGTQQDSCEVVQLFLDKIIDFMAEKKKDVRVLMNQLIRCEGNNCNNKYKICDDQQECLLISQALIERNEQSIGFKDFLESALEPKNCPDYNYECSCNNQKLFIQTVLTDLPTYLVIKVGRGDNFLRKINKKLTIANNFTLSTPVSLKDVCESGDSKKINHNYSLTGIIVHYGNSLNSGHYVAFIKKNGKWFLCNDSSITQLDNFNHNISEIENNSCVLLYVKQ